MPRWALSVSHQQVFCFCCALAMHIPCSSTSGPEQFRRVRLERLCNGGNTVAVKVHLVFRVHSLLSYHPSVDHRQKSLICSHRGTWYNILDWAARSTSCNSAPDSVACMACSQSMPAYSKPAGVAPIGNKMPPILLLCHLVNMYRCHI